MPASLAAGRGPAGSGRPPSLLEAEDEVLGDEEGAAAAAGRIWPTEVGCFCVCVYGRGETNINIFLCELGGAAGRRAQDNFFSPKTARTAAVASIHSITIFAH